MMRWSPAVTVAAVIRRGNRFLLVEERPADLAVVNQPAGHVEFGESPVDAVRREVLEETCRAFVPSGLLGIYQWTIPGSRHTYLRLCFVGSVGDTLTGCVRDPDILDTHWLTRDELEHGNLPPRSPLVLRCIDDALNADGAPLGLIHVVD
ncbi:MAG: NUDIX hydrolase [Gammaproteobacteria bacterium]|nr:NUDIX hydrolase [Gammaproteobacteria bacterium]MCP5299796.1 NUDIX hydrolase [Chromatiaceae bacterium]